MAGRKAIKASEQPRRSMGRARPGTAFPVPPQALDVPSNYANLLDDLKKRIATERLRITLAANAAMVLLYWDIGKAILQRQEREGWGAKVIDRLSADLRKAFPDMHGLSPRNLKYMRAFAEAWPDRILVQAPLAQITWYHLVSPAIFSRSKSLVNCVNVEQIEAELQRLDPPPQSSAPKMKQPGRATGSMLFALPCCLAMGKMWT